MFDASSIKPAGVFDVFDEVTETLSTIASWAPGFTPWSQEIARFAEIDSATRLVDLGCGTGRLLAALGRREPGAEFVGVDADRDSIAIARKRAASVSLNIGIEHGDLCALPFADEQFEVAMLTFVLRSVPRPTRSRILAEAARVLRPGGRVLTADWSARGCAAARLAAGALAFVPLWSKDDSGDGTPTLYELGLAGFEDADRVAHTCSLGGGVEILRAYKPVISQKS